MRDTHDKDEGRWGRGYILPHAISIYHVAASLLCDPNHAPIDVRRHAHDKTLGDLGTKAVRRPGGLDGLDVAPDTARRDEDGRAVQLKVAVECPVRLDAPRRVVWLEGPALDADDPTGNVVDQQLVDLVAELEGDEALLGLGLDGLRKDPHDLGADAPGDVKARHRVPMAVGGAGAPLGPADVEQEAHAAGLEVLLHVVGGKVHKGLGPLARPVVLLLAVEGGGAEPVAHGEVARVLDAQAALLGAVDAEDAAEGPEGLAAEVPSVLLVDDDDGDVVPGQLEGGDEACEAATDDEDGLLLCLGGHGVVFLLAG